MPNMVVIALCTYKRANLLPALIEKLSIQIRELSSDFTVRIAVIDNDPEGSAKSQLDNICRILSGVEFTYCHEPARGVGNARNRAFSLAEDYEWLALFDDDQIPGPNWLRSLLEAPGRLPGDLFVGPVRPRLPRDRPDWAEGAWAWSRPEFDDGALRDHAGFGNILLSPSVLKDVACKVPESFLEGPGEDTAVTSALSARGFKIVHVLDAWAWETVSTDRLSVPWVIARSRNAGRVWAMLAFEGKGNRVRLVLSLARLLSRAGGFGIRALVRHRSADVVRAKAQLATAHGYLSAFQEHLRRQIGAVRR